MAWSYPGEPWLFTILHPSEKGIHGSTQTKEDLLQELVVDSVQFWIMLATLFERLLCCQSAGPWLSIAQLHDPPVVQSPAFGLHEFQGYSILFGYLKSNLFTDLHLLVLLSAADHILEKSN